MICFSHFEQIFPEPEEPPMILNIADWLVQKKVDMGMCVICHYALCDVFISDFSHSDRVERN